MAGGIINPGYRKNRDIFDVINAGLNIAQTVQGMNAKSDAAEVEAQKRADEESGVLTGSQVNDAQMKGWQVSKAEPGIAPPESGFIKKVRGPNGLEYMVFRKPPEPGKVEIKEGKDGMYAVTPNEAKKIPGFEPKVTEKEESVKNLTYEDAEGNKRLGVVNKQGKLIKSNDDAIIEVGKTAKKAEDTLPSEAKAEIDKLAKDNANRQSIANLLRADLELMRKAETEDEKVVIGRGMLKTMNSLLGSDATGVEEVNRLGSLLERYNLPGQPGHFFTRDVVGFDKQVQAKILGAENSIKLNNERIQELKGSSPQEIYTEDDIKRANEELLRRSQQRMNAKK